MIEDLTSQLAEFFTPERIVTAVRAAAILLVGLLVARYGGRGVAKLVRGDPQQAQLLRRLTAWGLFLMSFAWALDELGFKLGVLLGAAGVLTVAVGFASQTTLSNMISGFFLFGERPFKVGDLIEVEGITGTVLSVDLMATKLRTFQNHYVRVPNELMIKTKVINLTRFPLRRLDLSIPIAYDEDFARVRELLRDIAEKNPLALAEPAPLMFVTSFAESRIEMQFSVWAQTPNYIPLKSSIQEEIKRAFDEHGIRTPFPHRIVHTTSADTVPTPRGKTGGDER